MLLQILLLVVFMCATLLLASLICLTLPGTLSQGGGLFLVLPAVFFTSPLVLSVCRPLADVLLDGQHAGP